MNITNKHNFLIESDPQKNIRMLADFSLLDVSGTLCLTQMVHQKLPKTDIPIDTQREICLLGTGAVLLSVPFYLLAQKVYQCATKNLSETFQCKDGLAQAIGNPANIMSYFCFASLTALAGAGTYAILRRCLEDSAKQERFDLLDKEYTAAAAYLIRQHKTSRGQERGDLAMIAGKLADKTELIRASLRQVARLTEPQTNLLIAKLSFAARSVLLEEKTTISQKKKA